jgi:hypothetical protein
MHPIESKGDTRHLHPFDYAGPRAINNSVIDFHNPGPEQRPPPRLKYIPIQLPVWVAEHQQSPVRRVDPGGFPPGPPTDPHVPNYSMRFFES